MFLVEVLCTLEETEHYEGLDQLNNCITQPTLSLSPWLVL